MTKYLYYPRHRRWHMCDGLWQGLVNALGIWIIIALAVLALIVSANYGEHHRCRELIRQHAAQWRIDRSCPLQLRY